MKSKFILLFIVVLCLFVTIPAISNHDPGNQISIENLQPFDFQIEIFKSQIKNFEFIEKMEWAETTICLSTYNLRDENFLAKSKYWQNQFNIFCNDCKKMYRQKMPGSKNKFIDSMYV